LVFSKLMDFLSMHQFRRCVSEGVILLTFLKDL
jgi:hypothetical protein